MAGEVQPIGGLPVHIPLTSEYLLAWGSGRDTFRAQVSDFLALIPSISDHGALLGLGDDDHPQYFNQARGDARYIKTTDDRLHLHANLASLDKINEASNLPTWNGAAWPGITVHSALTGLGADDHPQYFNQTRGDARYALIGSGVTAHGALSGLANDDHTQYYNQTRGDARYYTKVLADVTFATPEYVDLLYLSQENATATYLTKTAAASTYALLTDSRFHTHTNETTLDKITEASNLPLWNGAAWPGGGGGVTAHSALTGLTTGDDHTQYLNNTRGDARYVLKPGGGGAAFWNFNFSAATTSSPASGEIRFNNATQNLATQIYVSKVSSGGVDVSLALLSVPMGAVIYVQDYGDSDSFIRFTASTGAIDSGAFVRYFVTVTSSSFPLLEQPVALSIDHQNLGTGPISHSSLSGLTTGDDHTQYLNQARGDARYALLTDTRFHAHSNLTTLNKITEASNLPLWNGAAWPGSGGVTAHSALTGLGADDHTQYYNQTRGDARYLTIIGAQLTYLSLDDADLNYLTKTDANAWYLTPGAADAAYAKKCDAQAFTTAGTFTWNKPAGAVYVFIEVWGAGGGGGSGRKGAAASARSGGGGGGAAGYANLYIKASDLATSETVVVGAGGTGPAAVSANGTDGATGGTGGTSSFSTILYARGGLGGVGGTSANASGGAAAQGSFFAPGAGGQSNFAGAGTGGNGSIHTGGGGGAGSSITSGDVINPATGGGRGFTEKASVWSGTTLGGGALGGLNANGSMGTKGDGGGGGGATSTATNAGSGGNGVQPGGGGGGGGAGVNALGNAGGGGTGAAGWVLVTTYF